MQSAVHDVLAKRVRNPNAYYLPGSWVPHCALAQGYRAGAGHGRLRGAVPVGPIRATVVEVAVVDTHTGATDPLLQPRWRRSGAPEELAATDPDGPGQHEHAQRRD